MSNRSTDVAEALEAVERLHVRHRVLDANEARVVARLLTGEDIEFPLRRVELEPAATPGPASPPGVDARGAG